MTEFGRRRLASGARRKRIWDDRFGSFEPLEPRFQLSNDLTLGTPLPDLGAREDAPFRFDAGASFVGEAAGDIRYAAQVVPGNSPVVRLEQLAGDLQSPVQLVPAGDGSGRLFVIERTGQIRTLLPGEAGTDQVAPKITNTYPSATHLDAIITWTTDELTAGRVEYGTTPGLGEIAESSSTSATEHRVHLRGLASSSEHYYRVIATDEAGNTTAGPIRTFTTDAVPEPGEILYNGIVLPAQWPPANAPTQAYKVAPYLVTPPDVIDIDVGRQLFVDDFLIESTTLTRRPHRPEFYPDNPVLAPDGGADFSNLAMPYSDGVWFDPADQLFKMFYMGSGGNRVSYAYSHDGTHWIKPDLPDSKGYPNAVVQLGGGRDSTTVWMDLNATDPNRKFQLFAYASQSLSIWYSPDGLHWTKDSNSIYAAGDRTTVFYNPFRDVWVESMRNSVTLPSEESRDGYLSRARFYSESPDLNRWSPADPNDSYWVGPDVLDPIYYQPYGEPPELYNLDAVAYESVMVGLFSFWHPGDGYNGYEDPGPRVVEVGVGFSRDGFHWERPTRAGGDEAFIPASHEPGTWNGYNTQSVGGAFLVVGDELWFYVSGRTQKKPDYGTTSTGLAKLRRDGFYSMDAGSEEGVLTTRPVVFSGSRLFVNVDDPDGRLQVEVLDVHGNVLAPFTKANSIPVSADQTLHEVRWQGGNDLASLAGTPVRFRFHLTNGRLYSFWTSDSANGHSDGFVAAGGPGFTADTDTVGRDGYTPSTDATSTHNERRVVPPDAAAAHVLPYPFLELGDRVLVGDGRGLHGIALHPQFNEPGTAGSGKLYVYYSGPSDSGSDHDSILAEYRVSDSDPHRVDPESERILLRIGIPTPTSTGGGLAFGPDDGLLYLAVGDGGDAGNPWNAAQNPASLLGKVLRLDVDGSNGPDGQYGIPQDNPYAGQSGARGEIYAVGFHDPRQLSFDDGSGGPASPDVLLVADVGQSRAEEVNLVIKGGNYGWGYKEGSQMVAAASPPNLIDPIVEYPRPAYGEAVVGGSVYRGSSFPQWDGRYLFGDANGRLLSLANDSSMWRLQHDGEWFSGRPIGDSLLAVTATAEGAIYVSTPNAIYQVRMAPPSTSLPDWLSFDVSTGVFSGTPGNDDVGTTTIEVTARGDVSGQAAGTFDLTVLNVNDAPFLVAPIRSVTAFEGVPVRLDVSGHFQDIDPGDKLRFTAQLGIDSPLPDWLILDPDSGQLSGTAGVADAGIYDIRVVATDGGSATAYGDFTLEVVSNGIPPVVTITASKPIAEEPDQDGAYTVQRTGDLDAPLAVFFTVGGSASVDVDYASLGSSVTIPAGVDSVILPLNVVDDSQLEFGETVVVNLASNSHYELGTAATATVTIVDDDVPPVSAAPGLLAHWKLDETVGTIAADASGLHHHAVLANGPVWAQGRRAGSLQFDGVDDHLAAGTGVAIVGQGAFSVSAWVKTAVARDQTIVQQRGPDGFNGEYKLQMLPSGVISFWTYGGGQFGAKVNSTRSIDDDQWHLVTAVRHADGTSQIYLDGRLDAQAAAAPRTLIPLSVYIGADLRNRDSYWNGFIDDVRIYDRALTSAEIMQWYGDETPAEVTLVSVTATAAAASEPDGIAELTLSRSGSTTTSLPVYFTLGGTATAGVDYVSLGTTAVIPAGSRTVTLQVRVMDDALIEGHETVVVSLVEHATYRRSSSSVAAVTIASDDQPVSDTMLVAHWKLDELNGTTAGDASGHQHPATLVNGPVWKAAVVDGGLSFDGVDDYLDAGLGPAILGSGGFTVAAWIRTTAAAEQVIVQQRSAEAYNGEYVFQTTASGHLRFWMFGEGANGANVTSSQTIHDGLWHYVAAVREDDGTGKVYIDGKLAGMHAAPARKLVSIKVFVGADMRGGSRYFRGALDDVSIYERALTAAEIAAIADSVSPPPTGAQDDEFVAAASAPLSVSAPGLLENDLGAGLSISSGDVQSRLGAAIQISPAGGFVYDPRGVPVLQALPAGHNATDEFHYSLANRLDRTAGTVFVTVTGANDPPTAVDDAGETSARVPLSLSVLANDSDVDAGDALVLESLDLTLTCGEVSRNGDVITYDPTGWFDELSPGEEAEDTFAYVVRDSHGATSHGTVVITVVGEARFHAAEDTIEADEDTVRQVLAWEVLANDTSDDGADLWVVSSDPSSALGAAVEVLEDRSIRYDPTNSPALQAIAAGQVVEDHFRYTMSDGNDTASAFVTVLVGGRNDAPSLADMHLVVDENGPAVTARFAGDDVDSDDDPDTLTYSLLDAADYGVFRNLGDGQFRLDPAGPFESLAAGEVEVLTLAYRAADRHSATADAVVTIAVHGANDPPDAQSDSYTTQSSELLSVAAPGLLANDSDPDASDSLHVDNPGAAVSALGVPVTLLASGGFSYDPRNLALWKSHVPGSTVTDTFTYTVRDDAGAARTAAATVSVTVVERHPPLVISGAGQYVLTRDSLTDESLVYRNGVLLARQPIDSGGEINLSGAVGTSDSLTIRFVNGNPVPEAGITWNGLNGAASDTLTVDGGVFDRQTVQYGATPGDGTIVLTLNGADTAIQFLGIEQSTLLSTVADGVFRLTGLSDQVQLQRRQGGMSTLTGNTIRPTHLANPKRSLAVFGEGSDDLIDIRGNPLDISGADLSLNAEQITVNAPIQLMGGDLRASGRTFTSSTSSVIRTGGGDVVLNHTDRVAIGAAIHTSGGEIVSNGAGEFAVVSYLGNLQTAGATGGRVMLNHQGKVTLYGVTTGGGPLELHSANDIWLRGRIDLRGAGGASFFSSGVGLTTDTSANIDTDGGTVTLNHSGAVSFGSGVSTKGGRLAVTSASLSTAPYAQLTSGGGDIRFDTSGDVVVRGHVNTSGGNLESVSDQGVFLVGQYSAELLTYGSNAKGDVTIRHGGRIEVYNVLTQGGSVTLASADDVVLRGRMDTRRATNAQGGNFTSSGDDFASANNAYVYTGGGSASLLHRGNVTIGEQLDTGGGAFRVTGRLLTSLDSGARLRTAGGAATFDVLAGDMKSDVDAGGGAISIVLHVTSGPSVPLFRVQGNLDFTPGSLVTVDMDGASVSTLGSLPVSIARVIKAGRLIRRPTQAQVIDTALGEPGFTARLLNNGEDAIDLLIE